jgi:hypothetical protein
MSKCWLVKLTTNLLGATEWYISAAQTPDGAVAEVRELPGNVMHRVEVVRPLVFHELRAIKIDVQTLIQQE